MPASASMRSSLAVATCRLLRSQMVVVLHPHPLRCHRCLQDVARARQRKGKARVAPTLWSTLPGARERNLIQKGEPVATHPLACAVDKLVTWPTTVLSQRAAVQPKVGPDWEHRWWCGAWPCDLHGWPWMWTTWLCHAGSWCQCFLVWLWSLPALHAEAQGDWVWHQPGEVHAVQTHLLFLVVMPAWNAPGLFVAPLHWWQVRLSADVPAAGRNSDVAWKAHHGIPWIGARLP